MIRRIGKILAALALTAASTVVGVTATAGAAHADGCYTWGRALSQGMSGEDVRQLRIRVSGYPGYASRIDIDGAFGPGTRSAVIRFQQAYGLGADGVAGPQTFNQIYALQARRKLQAMRKALGGCRSTSAAASAATPATTRSAGRPAAGTSTATGWT
ncbi:peptidoglycan-binding domain-containing protein [Micromonospora olivasterospora]|uniref:peptidoglycan-binding domain-containing protein n=1 Tax=Micromonospora olivasterospora TaxID=1880 RepID=UPI001FE3C912|nr:peptidoglycan-binding domain-containing protein [Micromonospora olivasterospora]